MACFCTGACHQLGYCPLAGNVMIPTRWITTDVWSSWTACDPEPLHYGWICPRCKQSNGPDVVFCWCGPGSDEASGVRVGYVVGDPNPIYFRNCRIAGNLEDPELDGEAEPLEATFTDDQIRAAMRADTEHRHAGLEERIRAVLEAAWEAGL